MTGTPLVSICVPTYNGAIFIGQTLRSVLNQSYSNFEVIISDHSSTDQTLEVVKSLDDPRIKIVHLQSGGSVADNWNNSCQYATGKYIKLLCQDDLLLPSSIESHVSAMESDDGVSFSFSSRDVISPKGRRLIKNHGWSIPPGKVSIEDGLELITQSATNIVGEPCAVLFRRDYFDLTDRFKGKYLIDLNLWLDLWKLAPALKIHGSHSQFRVSKYSWTSQLHGNQSEEFLKLLEQLRKEFPQLISSKDIRHGRSRARKLEKRRYLFTLLIEKLRI